MKTVFLWERLWPTDLNKTDKLFVLSRYNIKQKPSFKERLLFYYRISLNS